MTIFKKYPSLTNHYQSKDILWYTTRWPQIPTIRYQLSEKLDGSNIAVYFRPNLPIEITSRKQHNNDFQGVMGLMNGIYADFTNAVQAKVDSTNNVSVRLYGEVFGKGIIPRIYYGEDKKVRFFDMEVDGLGANPNQFISWLTRIGFEDMHAPILAVVNSLEEALAYETESLVSAIEPETAKGKPNYIEGIVIKPFDEVIKTDQGSLFYLKKKNARFIEKSNEKMPKAKVVHPLNAEFRTYITESRMWSVFSKDGKPESFKDIGKFVKLILEDAKEDFLADNKEVDSSDKKIFNGGDVCAKLLKAYLIEQA